MTPAPADSNTRQRILDTALAEVERHGLTVSLEHLGVERIIKASGVSRATAYRHWPTKADFLADVLSAVVTRTTLEPESEADLGILLDLLRDNADQLVTEQGRLDLLIEGLRIATIADFRRVAASPQWRTLIALHATTASLPDGQVRAEVTAALAEVEARFTRARAAVYDRLIRLVGFRLKPPLAGPEGLAILADGQGALMTGLVVRERTATTAPGLSCAPFGSSREAHWPVPAFHLVHGLLSHLEPDPDITWDAARFAASWETLEAMLRAATSSAANPAP